MRTVRPLNDRHTCLVVLLFPLLVAGCGPNVSLKGRVSYSDDGKPVTQGTLYFVSGTHTSRAPLQRDGTFVVGSLKSNDGLPPGKYIVALQESSSIIGSTEMGDPIYKRLVDVKHENERTSGLTVEVPAPKGFIDFIVDRHPSKKQE